MNEEVESDIHQERVQTEDVSRRGKIQWHEAFYAALQLELHQFRDQLIFEDEHYLSSQPLRMDVLVIKKESGIPIEKNIGRIFEDYNVVEFKSEKDNLTIWDYLKVMGYAYLYASFEKIPIKAITVSFITKRHPRKLLKYLMEERQFKIKETMHGIYYVEHDCFKVQIIESQKLSEQENLFLKNLRSDLTLPSLQSLLKAYEKRPELDSMVMYLFHIMNANAQIFKEATNMISQHTYEAFEQFATKSGLEERLKAKYEQQVKEEFEQQLKEELKAQYEAQRAQYEAQRTQYEAQRAQYEAQRARETALKMLQKGFAFEEIAELVEMPVSWVEDLTK